MTDVYVSPVSDYNEIADGFRSWPSGQAQGPGAKAARGDKNEGIFSKGNKREQTSNNNWRYLYICMAFDRLIGLGHRPTPL